MQKVRIYTRRGDEGMTSLRAGGRVRKDDVAIELVGTVDEAQAFLGLARAEAERGGWLDEVLTRIERDLWVLMAEVTTAAAERFSLEAGTTAVTPAMVQLLESDIDRITKSLTLSPHFVVPGETRAAAQLDVARAVVRRAERISARLDAPGSQIGTYLNRLSDLCWALARSQEDLHPVQLRDDA